jgi:hypothetical protein
MDAQRQHHETMERLLAGRNLINRQRRRNTQELPCRSQILPERHLPAPMFTTLPQPNRLCRLTDFLLVLQKPRARTSGTLINGGRLNIKPTNPSALRAVALKKEALFR